MSEAEKPPSLPAPWPRPIHLYILGIVILGAGLIAGPFIYMTAAADQPEGDLAYGPGWEKRYSFQMERIGGKAAVMANDLSQGWSSLWSGRRLGVTVAVLCMGIALLCFHFARAQSARPADDRPGDRDP